MEEDFIENTSELEMTLKDFRAIPPKKDNYQNNNDIKSFVASFNNSIVKDALMPELKENEHQKRKLKKTVLKCVILLTKKIVLSIAHRLEPVGFFVITG